MNSVRLHRFGGTGPLLVLGPALGTSVRALWSECAALLQDRFHVVGWDLPGHDGAPGATAFDLADLAQWVLHALGDEAAEGFHWAGDSIGGAVGLHLLLRPDVRVPSAVLLCTGARIGTPAMWNDRAALVRAEGTAVLASTAPDRWFAPGFAERSPEHLEAFLRDLANTDDESYAAACDALATHDLRGDLHRVTTPVLAVAGDRDLPTPVPTVRHISSGVRAGRLEILPGVAHLAPIEAPAAVADLIAAHARATVDVASRAQVRAEGMKVRREVLGDPWVDAATAAASPLTADFQRFISEFAWGSIWTRPGLDRRMRSAVTITALVARGHHDELALHLRAALRNGLTREEIAEVLLQCAVYCGVPDANTAFRIASRILDTDNEDHA